MQPRLTDFTSSLKLFLLLKFIYPFNEICLSHTNWKKSELDKPESIQRSRKTNIEKWNVPEGFQHTHTRPQLVLEMHNCSNIEVIFSTVRLN